MFFFVDLVVVLLFFTNEIAALSRVAKNPRILTHACIMPHTHAFAYLLCDLNIVVPQAHSF